MDRDKKLNSILRRHYGFGRKYIPYWARSLPDSARYGIYYMDKSVLAENSHTKLHPGLEWRIFHILTIEDIDDVISRFYTVVCAKTLSFTS